MILLILIMMMMLMITITTIAKIFIFQKFCKDSRTTYGLEEEGDILVVTHKIGEVLRIFSK